MVIQTPSFRYHASSLAHCDTKPHPPTGPKQKKKRVTKQRQSLAEKQIGTTIFPISRVKRIIKADAELDMMTGEACFMVAVAAVGSSTDNTRDAGTYGW